MLLSNLTGEEPLKEICCFTQKIVFAFIAAAFVCFVQNSYTGCTHACLPLRTTGPETGEDSAALYSTVSKQC